MQIETRAFSEIREIDEADHSAHIRLVTYGRADSYGSNWQRGVFDESLTNGHIPAVWGHDKTAVYGSVREYDLQPTHADVLVGFADLDAVPVARMAYSLMKDRHVRDSSFGFSRVPGGTVSKRSDPSYHPSQPGERERVVKANLVEISTVLKGSVPDNGVLGVRDDPALLSDEQTDIAALILQRAPHSYRTTNGEGSVCAVCGQQPDAKVHDMTRQTILDLAASPVLYDDANLLIRAADAALDAALGLLTREVASDPANAALGLLMAADAMLDRSQDLLALDDADGDDGPVGALVRAFAEPSTAAISVTHTTPAGEVQDDVDRELERILRGQTSYGMRAEKPYGNVSYADPGYQDDKQKRYPLDTERHVRSAWTYIHQEDNRKPYNAEQLKAIEGRIKAAGKKYGISYAEDDSGKG
jgi:phage head maturation protease